MRTVQQNVFYNIEMSSATFIFLYGKRYGSHNGDCPFQRYDIFRRIEMSSADFSFLSVYKRYADYDAAVYNTEGVATPYRLFLQWAC